MLERQNRSLIVNSFAGCCLAAVAFIAPGGFACAETWRGLTIAPENRCSVYDRKRDYRYSQSIERKIVRELGAVYGPYTGTCFDSTSQTDIEHIVATSEAHDSGLCARDRETRARFAKDLRNLTLASPSVNRHAKSGYDAAEWIPAQNRCWFAARVVDVRRAYGLTIDRREAEALEQILSACENTEMEPIVCRTSVPNEPSADSATPHGGNALALYDDNRNGRITCKEARRHGIAPVPRNHPAYRYMHDGDGDGIVCESTAMEPIVCRTCVPNEPSADSATPRGGNALALYDDNRNGRITCKEARRHGIAPVPRNHPAYRYMHDGDGDGIVCE
ncbi:MAG: excalibur calcium-binding domain-containing protein [Albidovulum sp.]|nr:excalibur calcium-binding domain-containing protein [Albidovulum sp.]